MHHTKHVANINILFFITKEKYEKIYFLIFTERCFGIPARQYYRVSERTCLCCVPSDLQKVKLCVVKYNIGTLTIIMTFFTLAYLLTKAFFLNFVAVFSN